MSDTVTTSGITTSRTASLERVVSPPLAPDEQPIDFPHLFRMTLGDHSLEREVLELFGRQTELLLARMRVAEPAAAAALAHTLRGSARGIGAWGVASAAEQVEIASADGRDLAGAIGALSLAAVRARAAIADHLMAC